MCVWCVCGGGGRLKCLCHIFVFGQNNSAGGDLGLREKKISNHCRDRDFIVIVNQSQTKNKKQNKNESCGQSC